MDRVLPQQLILVYKIQLETVELVPWTGSRDKLHNMDFEKKNRSKDFLQ